MAHTPRMGLIIPIVGMKRIPHKHAPASAGGLADALFAKVQQRALGVLCRRCGGLVNSDLHCVVAPHRSVSKSSRSPLRGICVHSGRFLSS